ncbi:hypothetical protein BS47DRAFT_1154852 [Hydnum rufescens UP504]|uniref:Transcription initiation factor IIF subunit beta n=1 Tax=Hydnum rufescens UP504 TaxID=1448309 RepID=A0A9P6B9S6_9AGAM|nr:hypothetical protein BS47DRAFT_1154852 [Hydnum rufescens UP504]
MEEAGSLKRDQFEDDPLLDGDEGEEPNEFLNFTPQSAENVPKSLMETWCSVKSPGVHLGTVRVHGGVEPNGQPKVTLFLPENPQYDIGDETSEYHLEITNPVVHGQYVLADKPKEKSPNKRARTTTISGKIKHTAALKPVMSDAYEAKIRKRAREANRPKKTIVMLDERQLNAHGSNLKMIQSGALQTSAGFGTAKRSTRSSDKLPFERAARISRDELLDHLFNLFTPSQPYWSMKDLRKSTAQPEAYLKDVLGDIADFHKSGPQANTFSLKAAYASTFSSSSTNVAGPSGAEGHSGKLEDGGEADEDEDDEDDDMEEVA